MQKFPNYESSSVFPNNIFFTGVVEDRKDPLKLGRVRVRIHGIHTEDKINIPTETLPWASVIHNNSASVSGIGESSVPFLEGSWVVGFFQDGDARQKPILLGSFFGIPEEAADIQTGFYDPRTPEELSAYPRKPEEEPSARNYPKVDTTFGNKLHENDLNRLARNEFVAGLEEESKSSIIEKKNSSRDKNVPTALGFGGVWDEPNSRYDAVYPFNAVTESESGHVFEVDDTPGAERLHEYHRSGTFTEIAPDGSKVQRIVRNNYEIVLQDNFVHIQGVSNITTNGNFNLLSSGSIHLESKNNLALHVHSNVDIRVDGNMVLNVKGGDLDINVESGDLVVNALNVSANISGNLVSSVGGDTEIHTSGDLDLKTDGNVNHVVGGDYNLFVTGKIDMRGNPITLNPDKS